MSDAFLIIVLHQVLFQGAFAAKNLLLRIKLGKPIRGKNSEARVAVAFFALFIALALYFAWSGARFGAVHWLGTNTSTAIALLFLALNLLVGITSLRDLGESWRVGVIEEQVTELVEDGIYRFSRNPYFVSYLLMFAGYTALLQNGLLLLLSLAGSGLVHNMIRREEQYLETVHGEEYREYLRRVPRYLLL
jgi:protein-S-isoprenylcysteine O-methyltransferase Ste14